MSGDKSEILAVHKLRLEQYLRELELWEPLLKGELRCASCNETITSDNIGVIFPSGERILFCCMKHDCLFQIKKSQEGRT
jgi:hypothetical protein